MRLQVHLVRHRQLAAAVCCRVLSAGGMNGNRRRQCDSRLVDLGQQLHTRTQLVEEVLEQHETASRHKIAPLLLQHLLHQAKIRA